ncbi:MAG TPA: hypothetical protein VF103_08630 [Polyangiaceae bacterium]
MNARLASLSLVSALGLASTAGAAEKSAPERHGFVGGGALGGGVITAGCDGCDVHGAIGIDLHLGGMLTPRLALLFDASGATSYSTEFAPTRYVASLLYAGAAQYFVTQRLWIKGGVGIARVVQSDAPLFETFESETGFGFLVAGGYELLQRGSFALDAQIAVSPAFYAGTSVTDAVALVGVNWY